MKKGKIIRILMAGAFLLLTGCAAGATPPPAATPSASEPEEEQPHNTTENSGFVQFASPVSGDKIAVMETSMGTIRIRLFPEHAPLTVENFVGLIEEGFYNDRNFHRVINDFMIQGGALNPDGSGGTSIFRDEGGNAQPFVDEFSDELRHFRGALSMANPGMPNHNLSQFFVVQADSIPESFAEQMRGAGFPEDVIAQYQLTGGTPHLDGGHTIFGQVIQGMDVVDAIAAVPTQAGDRPVDDVLIISLTVETVE